MPRLILLSLLLALPAGALAQTLYKYKDEKGQWQFTDRKPDGAEVEAQTLSRELLAPRVVFEREVTDQGIVLHAVNQFHAPVELELALTGLRNVSVDTRRDVAMVLAPDSRTPLLTVIARDPTKPPGWGYTARYMIGDPAAEHRPPGPYRAPFAPGAAHRVSQAWPEQSTHTREGSQHAVDIAMPVGTPLHAARGGVVLAIAYDSYTGGTDRRKDGPKANLVRILHDDGTMAVYAHLKWESIRVRPGQRVGAGEYIADSGNTGFSSGPHLHFAVERNVGMALEALPVTFQGVGGSDVTAVTGEMLTAW